MSDVFEALRPGQQLTIRLSGGGSCQGTLEAIEGGWLRLTTASGIALVQVAHIAVIAIGDQAIGLGLPKPSSKESPAIAGSRAPGRAWSEDDLRLLADAFLDGKPDSELADRFKRSRGAIKEMHQGFEAARGNLVEDQISPVARTWIARWRRVLGG